MGQSASADDVVQDVMLTIWRKADTFDPAKAAASSWIFTIARNRMIDHHRRTSVKTHYESEAQMELPQPMQQADDLIIRGEDSQRVSKAVRTLPDGQAKILELSYRDGLTHQEIATRLNEPLGTIKSRIRLAMQKLRLHLGETT